MAAPLPVGKILLGAFLIPWWNRKAFARALAIPMMLIVALTLSWYYAGEHLPSWANWAACLGYAAFFALFAVTCHRLVLLDPARVARRAEPRWTWRESLFLWWLIGAWLTYVVVSMAGATLLGSVLANATRIDTQIGMRWVIEIAGIPAIYAVARMSPAFPAVAIDHRPDLKWALAITRGNGWRLFVVVGVLPWALSSLVGLAYRSNPSPLEMLALAILGTALFAVEIAALSISYRELTREN